MALALLESLQVSLEPYRHLDPVGWVAAYRLLPPWAGAVGVAVGGLLIFFGGGRLFRLVAGPLGAAIAAIWSAPLASRLGFGAHTHTIWSVSVLLMCALGLLAPPVVVFFAFGVPLGLIAGQLAGSSDWLLGFVPGLVVGGAVGVVLRRVVAAVLSSVAGAWILVLGAMAALTPFAPEAVGLLAAQPVVAMSIAGCGALGGIVYQLFGRSDPRAHPKKRSERVAGSSNDRGHRALEAR